jgi:hypothetical protein
MTEVPAYLATIFNDPRWRQIDLRLYYAEIDGQKIGSVLATWNQRYGMYNLNCPELERLIAALREGKIARGFVVGNGTGRYEFRRAVNAERLYERLRNKPTIDGKFGKFWALAPYELELEEEVPF